MRNREIWRESKYVWAKGGLWSSADVSEVRIESRFLCDILAQAYASAIQQHARGRLLDLGCGKAPLYGIYRGCTEEIICVDWVNTRHRSPYLDLEQDLNQPLPVAAASIDTMLATDVLEHIAHPSDLWREMARLLAPGGKLILGVPFLYGVHEAPYDYFRYTEFALQMFCRENGLAVVELKRMGGSPEVQIDFAAKHLGFSRIASVCLYHLGRLFVRSPLGQRLSQLSAPYFPLGYCLVARKNGDVDVT